MNGVKGVMVGLLIAAGVFMPLSASAELSIAFYAGKQLTGNGDLRLKQGQTDLTFHDVSWKDESFELPIYYGARLSYWFDELPFWGVAVDFTHAKIYLNNGDTVAVTGTRNGAPVDAREPVSDSIRNFSLSHGLNMVTLNGLHRWFPSGKRDLSPLGRVQPYAGLGAGFSIPHVEADISGVKTDEYQLVAGPVANGMVGLNYDVNRYLSGMVEYKLTYADVRAELHGGGFIDAATISHQLVFGLAANFNLW